MTKIQKLFEEITNNSALQTRFLEIMKDTGIVEKENIIEKLIVFAKDAGYDIAPDEIQAFFNEFAAKDGSELSDEELDVVAGGSGLTDSISSVLRRLIKLNCFRSDGIMTS